MSHIPGAIPSLQEVTYSCFICVCRSQLLYYMVLVASKDIEPFEEITYNYNYRQREDDEEAKKAAAAAAGGGGGDVQMGEAGRVMVCACGAPNCSGRLL